jgi:glyoxylase-like metal-dependent hydrolase (beta-lactamase superfamily II)
VKAFAKIAGLLLLLLLAALLVLLLPAHLQVRDVDPALPSEQSLRALLAVENGPTRVRFVTTSSQQAGARVLSHNSVIVEWANGDMLLIDPGMDAAAAIDFGELMKAMQSAEDPVIHGTISQLLGTDINRVKAVGFTHLHIDHAQGVINFCEARGEGASALQTAYQTELHNFNTSEGAALVANSCLQQEIVEGDGLVSFDQFPGLALYPLGGHTPGSTLFAVADSDRLLLFSGDITNTRDALVHDQPKPWLYSYLMVPENTDRTALLRDWLGELNQQEDVEVIVSHDLENMQSVLEPFTPVPAAPQASYTERWNSFQTAPPAQVMLLGSFHFADPGLDSVKVQSLDVTTAESQAYLEQLSVRIAQEFRPTTILLEYSADFDATLNERYQLYLADRYELPVNEIYQLGFRVARASGLGALASWDHKGMPWNAEPMFEYAKEHDPKAYAAFEARIAALTAQEQLRQNTMTLQQLLKLNNDPVEFAANKALYIATNAIGAASSYEGADAAASWWHRNFRMYAKVQRIAKAGERVLVIGGSGHIAIVADLLAVDDLRVAVPVLPLL